MAEPFSAPEPSPPAAPGTLPERFGRYRVLKLLGKGGMGSVYLAEDTALGRQVALKVPYFSPGSGPEVLQRFLREARLAATLHHPNICPVYDVGQTDGIDYLAMAFIPGRPLAAYVDPANPLPPNRAAALVRKLAQALQEAHESGVIHRDLKPANIMINSRGEPVIMDFGLAYSQQAGDARLTESGMVVGTPAYMSPEQIRGETQGLGPLCDVYSLGMILYELLAGRVPFHGPPVVVLGQVLTQEPPPPSALRADVDPRLEAICLRAIAKKPEARYEDMAELAEVLGVWLRADKRSASPNRSRTRDTRQETRDKRQETRDKKRKPSVAQRGPSPDLVPSADEAAADTQAAALPTVRDKPRPSLKPPRRRRRTPLWLAALAMVGLGAAAGWFALLERGTSRTTPDKPSDEVAVVPPTTAKEEPPRPVPPEVGQAREKAELARQAIPAAENGDAFTAERKEIEGLWQAGERALAKKANPEALAAFGAVTKKSQTLVGALQQWRQAREAQVSATKAWEGVRYVDRGQKFGEKLNAIEAQLRLATGLLDSKSSPEARKAFAEVENASLELKKADEQRQQAREVWAQAEKARQRAEQADAENQRALEWGEILRQAHRARECFDEGDMKEALRRWQEVQRICEKVLADIPEIQNSIAMRLVRIPAGRFRMGSPKDEEGREDNEGPQHMVEISQWFYLGKFEVTQEQYRKVMNQDPSWFSTTNKGLEDKVFADTSDFPVDSVSWNDAVKFCQELSKRPEERKAGRRYELPTEAEWEYACRGGTDTPFYFGRSASSEQAQCNHQERTCRVGQFATRAPHPWGLCDMHGNVAEWCQDRYERFAYKSAATRDPHGPDQGEQRVLRGGSYGNEARRCRAAFRSGALPSYNANGVGFRVRVRLD
jgi:formylglycine-generating enzyme required for sulfatase activity/serine/threonine protein kinase